MYNNDVTERQVDWCTSFASLLYI